jgi:hypothetical protein
MKWWTTLELFDSLIANPENITFTFLFIGLFVYVMRTNERRESHYRETIQVLTNSLNECESTKIKLTNLGDTK